jgi:hypothetical protein
METYSNGITSDIRLIDQHGLIRQLSPAMGITSRPTDIVYIISIAACGAAKRRTLTPKIALRPWRKAHENAAFEAGLTGLTMVRSREPPAR